MGRLEGDVVEVGGEDLLGVVKGLAGLWRVGGGGQGCEGRARSARISASAPS